WEALSKLDPYVRRLSASVMLFQEKDDELSLKHEQMNEHINALRTCPLTAEEFKSHIDAIQQSVDELNLGSYSNLKSWVGNFDQMVVRILGERLKEAVSIWNKIFTTSESDDQSRKSKSRKLNSSQVSKTDSELLHEENNENIPGPT